MQVSRAALAMGLLLLVAMSYWLWFGLTQRSVDGDDGISILAAQGILEYGIPRLPSGYLYHRAYVPDYLLAGSIGLFGLDDFAILFSSLLLALGTLALVYCFAKDVLGNPWLGVAAAGLLVLSQLETYYATGARMYMTLQFFSMLAMYAGYRGFVEGRAAFQLLTGVAVACAVLSHEEGGALVAALPVALLLVNGLTRRSWNWLFNARALAAGALALGALWFIYVYEPSEVKPLIALHGGNAPDKVGLNLSLASWMQHAGTLNLCLPLLFFAWPWALLPALRRFRSQPGWAYGVLTFGLCAALVLLILKSEAPRMWMFLLPLYALLVCAGVELIYRAGSRWGGKGWRRSLAGTSLVLLVLIGPFIALEALKGKSVGWVQELVSTGYGFPCRRDPNCDRQIAETFQQLRPRIESQDLIVSSTTAVTHYYLGRLDGKLRERKLPSGELGAFETDREELVGALIVDRLEELQALRDADRRVWVILNHKAWTYSSEAMLGYVQTGYVLYHQDPFLTVYVNFEGG